MDDDAIAQLDREIDELFNAGPDPVSARNLWRREYRKRSEVRERRNVYERAYSRARRANDPEWKEGRNQARRAWYMAKQCSST